MALDGPGLVYSSRTEEETLARALRLAREVEELLEDTSLSVRDPGSGAHSTRIVRAMAASLVDELEAIVRGTRKNGAA